jgi:hypothetical protein
MKNSFIAAVVLVMALLAGVSSAQGETTGPVWKVLSVSNPTNFKPGDKSELDTILVTVTNVGGAAAGCTQTQIELEETHHYGSVAGCPPGTPVTSPITITDALPKRLTAVEVFGTNAYHNPIGQLVESVGAEQAGPPFGLSCKFSPTAPSCTTSERIDPGDTLVITIRVDVETKAEGESEVNEASVAGGGAVSASVSEPVSISTSLPPYGVAKGGLLGATSTSQAGGHPNVTSEFFLNTINSTAERNTKVVPEELDGLLASQPAGLPKDARFDLPQGLVGTTVGVPRCTMAEVINQSNCPQNTMVGAATVIAFSSSWGSRLVLTVPVFNIAPAPGEPAAFAFNALYFPVRLDTSVLSDGEYNVRVTAPDITSGASTYMSSITIWGDPAEHNGPGPDFGARNLSGSQFLHTGEKPQISFGGAGVEQFETYKTVQEQRVPLLTNPSQCSSPLTGILETDPWEGPGAGKFAKESTSMGTATGCGQLSFKPSVSMLPDTLEAGAPAGYTFKLKLPQNTEPEGLATADVKRTSVTLPAGTVISPSIADGLGVCSNQQFYGPSGRPGESSEPATAGSCPNDSQVGTVRVKTPALEEPLAGAIYLATPECEPCSPEDAADGKMVRAFLQFVGAGEDGILIKQELKGQINQQTGQLTLTDPKVPQLPFSELELTAQGGERAAFANPRTCGTVSTTAELEPWSTPFTSNASPTSPFEINANCFGAAGAGGGAPFNPSFVAGTTSNQAGGFSPFTLSFGRGDNDQFLNGIQLQMPPGLLGELSKVKLCGEPQAAEGTCGPESEIGETTVETGPGADPFLVKGGKVYITGPYKGAPYGLSIVVPAKAGPYTLAGTTGKGTVVNRSAISINPETAALTVTSDPLPTELDGIPLQLRLVNVTVGTNNNFTFNATNCNKTAINGALTSVANAVANESSSYEVTNCAALKFKSTFTAFTAAKTSKANGASLTFKLTAPGGPGSNEVNFSKAKVDLPKMLPSRLTTLQKACTAAVFDANPASCPSASVIGHVKVVTPLLPVPLEGPAIFVSHGGEAFPSVIFVLQGYGTTIDVVSTTFISKSGVTSATLKAIPDAPFTSFELTFPEGKYSALAANLPAKAKGDFCGQTLTAPTEFTAQNGTPVTENTKVTVTGCPKAKKAVKKKAKKAKKARTSSNNGRAKS